MYYPCSENKGADQLRGYREADLRLCFRSCKLLVFSRTGSYVNLTLSMICIYIIELDIKLNVRVNLPTVSDPLLAELTGVSDEPLAATIKQKTYFKIALVFL